ncbi:MAG TPA: choice-of-anchor R domain-containing protein [Rhizomicrobium sp.]|jgi:hypothetical protein|nr:choice-of-anchor R domain-containing protein [Rhizomicrobium sp.]
MIRKVLVFAAALAFAGTTALAAGTSGVTLSSDKRITSIRNPHSVYTPHLAPKNQNLIFSNIGFKYAKGLYFCCYGNTISGSNSLIGQTYWLAGSFVPESDATVKEIDAAVGYVTGANTVVVTLYDDNGGVPGNVLAKGKASGLTTFGTCCGLAIAKGKHVALTAGHTYWVAVTTDGADSDTWAAWNFNSTNQIDPVSVAVSNGGAWSAAGGEVPAPSFAVIGD